MHGISDFIHRRFPPPALLSLLFLLYALAYPVVGQPARAQTADSIYQQACGPRDVKFVVEQVKGQPPAVPDPGKALVFFIQDGYGAPYIAKVGLDGAWAGAIKRASYLFASIAPGEHHACAVWQRDPRTVWNPTPHFVHFTAEAGRVYYYLIRSIGVSGSVQILEFGPVDRDEALFLIASDPQSLAKPKR